MAAVNLTFQFEKLLHFGYSIFERLAGVEVALKEMVLSIRSGISGSVFLAFLGRSLVYLVYVPTVLLM